jgi:hypothetical protein
MRIVWAAALATVVMLSTPAEACSCAEPSFFPFQDQTVPLNAKLPVLYSSIDSTLEITSSNGDVVPYEIVPTSDESFLLGFPQPLSAGSSYSVDAGIWTAHVQFTAGTTNDTTAPETPTLRTFTHSKGSGQPRNRDTCDLGGEDFEVSFDNPAGEAVVFELFTGPSVATIDQTKPARVLQVYRATSFTFGDRGRCTLTSFPASQVSDLAIQVRAVDYAGNVSDFSNALQLKSASSGCSATGSTALILLSALFLRRRGKE